MASKSKKGSTTGGKTGAPAKAEPVTAAVSKPKARPTKVEPARPEYLQPQTPGNAALQALRQKREEVRKTGAGVEPGAADVRSASEKPAMRAFLNNLSGFGGSAENPLVRALAARRSGGAAGDGGALSRITGDKSTTADRSERLRRYLESLEAKD